jgi:hypothetical protein
MYNMADRQLQLMFIKINNPGLETQSNLAYIFVYSWSASKNKFCNIRKRRDMDMNGFEISFNNTVDKI